MFPEGGRLLDAQNTLKKKERNESQFSTSQLISLSFCVVLRKGHFRDHQLQNFDSYYIII